MAKRIVNFFEHEGNHMGVDAEGKLYWNEELIVTKHKVSLQWWVNISIVVASLSTLAMAIFAGISCF